MNKIWLFVWLLILGVPASAGINIVTKIQGNPNDACVNNLCNSVEIRYPAVNFTAEFEHNKIIDVGDRLTWTPVAATGYRFDRFIVQNSDVLSNPLTCYFTYSPKEGIYYSDCGDNNLRRFNPTEDVVVTAVFLATDSISVNPARVVSVGTRSIVISIVAIIMVVIFRKKIKKYLFEN